MGLRQAGLADYRFFVGTGCCPEEQEEFGDIEEMNATKLHPRFLEDYPGWAHTTNLSSMYKSMMYFDAKDQARPGEEFW